MKAESVVKILLAIVGVAVIAELVSNKAKTSDVFTSIGSGFGCALRTALSPILGASSCGGSGGGSIPSVSSSITFDQIQ